MRLPAHIRRFATAALLPMLLLASVGPAGTFFFCRSMQEVMVSSCCPVEEAPESRLPQIDEAPCCERFTVAPSTIDSERPQRPSHQLASPPLAVLSLAASRVAPRFVSLPPVTSGWSNTGPPVLDRIESLLI